MSTDVKMDTLMHMKGNIGLDVDACDDTATRAIVRVITSDSCEQSCRQSCATNEQCKMAVFDATNRTCVHSNVARPLSIVDTYHTVETKSDVVTFVKSTCSKKCKSNEVDNDQVVDGLCMRWMTTDGSCNDVLSATTTHAVDCRACAMVGDADSPDDEEDGQCDARAPPLHGMVGECPERLSHGRACAP